MTTLFELKGKTIDSYDTWNGSRSATIIDKVEFSEDTIKFINEDNHWNNVYLPYCLLETLLETGKAEKHNEIDHCSCKVRYSIY